MLNLKTQCIHPTTQKPYILNSSGGRDNSPEGMQVYNIQAPFLCFIYLPTELPLPLPYLQSSEADPRSGKGGFTHGFVVEFGSKEDRDYYVSEDKAHLGFVKWVLGEGLVQEAKVVDYEVGVY